MGKFMNEPVAWIWSEDGCNMGVCLDQDKQIGKQEFQDYSIPLYTHPVKEQELLDEITKLRWKVNNLEIDIDLLRTTLFDIRQKYDTKNKQYAYTQVYVDELQAKIEALKSHPVKEQDTDCQYCKQGCIRCDARKQLTDEEILKEAESYGMGEKFIQDAPLFHAIKFAKAILRKAQEK